jgi:uncharacterized protein YkwD
MKFFKAQGIIILRMKKWIILSVLFFLVVGVAGWYYFFLKQDEKPKVQKPRRLQIQHQLRNRQRQDQVQLDTADIHALINKERTSAKLRALTVNDDLYDSALAKCEDMQKNNYFTHVSPKGVDYNAFIKKAVPTAKLTGENLGAGYADEAQLVKDWMASDTHKANILNAKFTEEAIATCGKSSIKPGLIVVTHFIQN